VLRAEPRARSKHHHRAYEHQELRCPPALAGQWTYLGAFASAACWTGRAGNDLPPRKGEMRLILPQLDDRCG
jgi:hypothetical protein